jgi:DNA modification methylase
LAKKRKNKISTPPVDAPINWSDISAEHWQSNGGRWAAPIHYMCSYMAMFPPELPHYFIERFTKKGDHVLDPFSGRGTTAVEAAAQARYGIGNDLNPLSIALTRGKISNPTIQDVMSRLDELESNYDASEWRYFTGAPNKIRMIYHINTLRQLMYLKKELDWSKEGVDSFIVAVLMGAMHGQSKGFLSLSMPNTFSMGWGYIKKYKKEKNLECPDRDCFVVLKERVKRMLAKGPLPGSGETIYGDVRNLSEKVQHDSIQLLFTSPPYLKVIKYGLYNWIRLWFLMPDGSHKEVDKVLDDTHALEQYLEFMKETLTATLPLLDRKRGVSCWAIGDVKDVNLAWAVWYHVGQNIEITAENGQKLRYKLIAIIEDKIPENQKVTKIWKTLIYHLESLNKEGIVIEKIGTWESEGEAKKAMKDLSRSDDVTFRIREEKTNDKTGKATPTDRILILSPDSSNPVALKSPEEVQWNQFFNIREKTIHEY